MSRARCLGPNPGGSPLDNPRRCVNRPSRCGAAVPAACRPEAYTTTESRLHGQMRTSSDAEMR